MNMRYYQIIEAMSNALPVWNPKQVDPALLTFNEWYEIVNPTEKHHPSSAYDVDVESLKLTSLLSSRLTSSLVRMPAKSLTILGGDGRSGISWADNLAMLNRRIKNPRKSDLVIGNESSYLFMIFISFIDFIQRLSILRQIKIYE